MWGLVFFQYFKASIGVNYKTFLKVCNSVQKKLSYVILLARYNALFNWVLGQLSRGKLPLNPYSNPDFKPNPHSNRGQFSPKAVVRTLFNCNVNALSRLRQFLAIESPLKTLQNAFYFTLKALFVLKIFEFLLWLFRHMIKRVH